MTKRAICRVHVDAACVRYVFLYIQEGPIEGGIFIVIATNPLRELYDLLRPHLKPGVRVWELEGAAGIALEGD